jgi:hypothetical protein
MNESEFSMTCLRATRGVIKKPEGVKALTKVILILTYVSHPTTPEDQGLLGITASQSVGDLPNL